MSVQFVLTGTENFAGLAKVLSALLGPGLLERRAARLVGQTPTLELRLLLVPLRELVSVKFALLPACNIAGVTVVILGLHSSLLEALSSL